MAGLINSGVGTTTALDDPIYSSTPPAAAKLPSADAPYASTLDKMDISPGTSTTSTAPAAPATKTPSDFTDQLNSLYQKDFNRAGDAGGMNFWGGQMVNGATPEQIDQAFHDSPEYASLHPSVNPNVKQGAWTEGYKATPWNVTTPQTVQGQLQTVLDPNNPLMVQARTQADQQSNARGLINSSIGVSAGEDAMIKNALPIAQQDATTNANSGQFNANSSNQANAFNAQASNTASISNADNATKMLQSQLGVDSQMALAKLSSKTTTDLATFNAQNTQLLKSSESASSLFNQIVTNMANISSSTTMDGPAKQIAIDNQMIQLRQGMNAISANASTAPSAISSLNLAQYFPADSLTPIAPDAPAAAPAPTGTDDKGDSWGRKILNGNLF